MAHPFFDLPLPLVIGHRGASGELPENTVPAFERALAQGAVILETDVHATRDGTVVVAHDADLARMTDGQGAIRERDLAELQALDAGYGFSPDGGASHPARGQGIRIPTLRQVFERFPDARFNVEIKQNSPALIEGALELIAEFDRADRTLVAAEQDDTMAALRTALKQRGLPVAMGAAIGDVVGFVQAARSGSAPPPEPMALQVPPAFAGQPLVTPELVSFAHEHGVQIHVWTVNDEDEMHRLLELGVDGVMSDFPGRLQSVVRERGHV